MKLLIPRIGKSSQRDIFNKSTVSPGPKYIYEKDLNKSSTKSFKFGTDKKMKPERSLTPGPGNYESKPVFGKEGKKNSIGVKTELINSSKYNPGVGTYDLSEKNKPNPKSYKIMKGKRPDTFLPKDPDFPAPCDYTPEKRIKNTQPKWTLGKKDTVTSLHGKLEKSHRDKPSVGSYNIDKHLKDGPKVNI